VRCDDPSRNPGKLAKIPELRGRRLERRKENEFGFAGRGQGGGKDKGRSSKK